MALFVGTRASLKMKVDVSVIIVNYNTPRLTKDCVDSVFDKTKDVSFEVIVVDNASKDNSVSELSKDKRIILIKSEKNLGFGKANNLALSHAQGKYVFFLNSDTYLLNNALKEFYDFAESQTGKVGAIGSILYAPDGGRSASYGCFRTTCSVLRNTLLNMLLKPFGKHHTDLDDPSKDIGDSFYVDYVTGADLFISRDVIKVYGSFDPDFFMYYEETEMQYRYAANGFHSVITKAPRIVHLEGASLKSKNEKKNFNKMMIGQTSQFVYLWKTQSRGAYYLFRVLYYIIRMPVVFLSPYYTFKEKMKYHKLLLTGIEELKHKI